MMVNNMGPADRVVRGIAAVILALLVWAQPVEGWFGWLLIAIAVYLLATAVLGSCLIYRAIDIDSHVHGEKDERLSL